MDPMTAKMSRKNQIVIPSAARNMLGLIGGDEVILIPKGNVFIFLKKPRSHKKALSGSIPKSVGAKLLKEIEGSRSSW